jgi:16S rRNA (cytosine967-C5)-methyltransferase
MIKQTPRDSALGFLNRGSNNALAPDLGLPELFRKNPHFDERDRSFITNLVQGVLRWRLKLDWIIEQYSKFPLNRIDTRTLNILRLATYQILFLDRVPDSAAVNEAVEQTKKKNPRHVVSFVNAILRRISRQKENLPKPDREEDPVLYLSVEYSYPSWLVKMWNRDYGLEFTERLLSAQNHIPRLVIRANILKTRRDELIRTLNNEGVQGIKTHYAPDGLVIQKMKGSVEESPAFRSGLFQVQDEAAQIAAYLLSPKPGEIVLDVCAGLGGKTSHLAEIMTNKGILLALDISHWRLLSLMRNARRLGLKSVKPVVFDATAGLSSLFRVKFDRILVDAPCSGLGVLSRHPDGKWNRSEADLSRLATLQQSILRAVIPVLKEGGRMLYMTCTISRGENEGLVELLLKENRNIKLLDLRKCGPEWCQDLIDDKGFYRTWPHIHEMDGFFGALFEKIR